MTDNIISPSSIELCIPIQALEINKVHLSPLQLLYDRPSKGENKPIAPLSYMDSGLTLPCLSLLLPSLKISRWDPSSGRLDLDLSQHSYIYTKIHTLQEYIINTVFQQQQSWLNKSNLDIDVIRSLLQPLIYQNTLTIFLHGPNPTLKSSGRTWVWCKNTWVRGTNPSTFIIGNEARICVRLHGLCLIPQKNNLLPKFRIQHQVICAMLT